jgi:hypothetical protein
MCVDVYVCCAAFLKQQNGLLIGTACDDVNWKRKETDEEVEEKKMKETTQIHKRNLFLDP